MVEKVLFRRYADRHLAALNCRNEIPGVVVTPSLNVTEIEIVDYHIAVRVRVQVSDERQTFAAERKPLVPAVWLFLPDPLIPIVGVSTDDIDDARNRRFLG
jgi:hypothetical protein